jgi:hypothetical protein
MNGFTLLAVVVVWLPFGALKAEALFVVVVLMGVGTGSFVPLGVAVVSGLSQPGTTGTFLVCWVLEPLLVELMLTRSGLGVYGY